jgi:hypothetical protein
LSSRQVIGHAALDSRRTGTAEQPGISSGVLADQRESRVLILASDWRWQRSPRARFDFGAEYRHSSGHFRYDDDVQFDLLFDVPVRRPSRPEHVHCARTRAAIITPPYAGRQPRQ